MLEIADRSRLDESTASRAAGRNWAANRQALAQAQPLLIEEMGLLPSNIEWVFARDGSLSGLDPRGDWWQGCSLPSRAAEYMLRNADLTGTIICVLNPLYAAHLRRALDRMSARQALLALVPDLTCLRMILACEDFSSDLCAHRLYFAAGEQWEQRLDQLFTDLPGLPTPTQFIRPIMADSAPADALIAPAQKIFAEHSRCRAQRVAALRENWTSRPISRIGMVAPAHFRLWDDTGHALAAALSDLPAGISVAPFNPDNPASASPAALAAAAAECDAIVMPNMARSDLPNLIPDNLPWLTWFTSPRIPLADQAGPNDALLVADPDWKTIAIEKGWNPSRVFIAAWPQQGATGDQVAGYLAIISDTQLLDPPARVVEYSSHRLLWEHIADELLTDPLKLGPSADEYLNARMHQLRIDEKGFNRAAFLDGIILHAWQQGVARLLLRENIPLKLFGAGWEQIEEFRNYSVGPVGSRQEFSRAIESCAAIVHAWPKSGAHPIESAGKPVILVGQRPESLLRDARLAVAGALKAPQRSAPVLSSATILRALNVA